MPHAKIQDAFLFHHCTGQGAGGQEDCRGEAVREREAEWKKRLLRENKS